jgi:hypothetical protein
MKKKKATIRIKRCGSCESFLSCPVYFSPHRRYKACHRWRKNK